MLFPLISRALERAAIAHRDQRRKGTDIPYISHPAMVGLILQRAGFDDETIAAGILHDVVEDAGVSLGVIERDFGKRIAELVNWLSEQKRDEEGRERPWQIRKEEHLEKLRSAPLEAKAIALADKLHNLYSTLQELQAGNPVWSRFKATPERWLEHARRIVQVCSGDDARLRSLARECEAILEVLERIV